jgi:hypothetical protein
LIFFDDYASVLDCGTSMRSITEEKKISPDPYGIYCRYIATVVSITILSTWSAFESSLMVSSAEVGRHKEIGRLICFSRLFPFIYALTAGIFLAFLVALTGEMVRKKIPKIKEHRRKKKKLVIGEGADSFMSLYPLLTLILCAIGGLLYSDIKKFNTLKKSEIKYYKSPGRCSYDTYFNFYHAYVSLYL